MANKHTRVRFRKVSKASIRVNDNNLEDAIKALKRITEKSGKFTKMLECMEYESPSVRRRKAFLRKTKNINKAIKAKKEREKELLRISVVK